MNFSAFLPLAALCLAAPLPAATPADHCLAPAECGLPPLDFSTSPYAPEASPEHGWQQPGGQTLRARLLLVQGYGTKQARAVLCTPEGDKHYLALEDMLPGDRMMVENWVKTRGFTELPLRLGGSVCARVMARKESQLKHPFPFLEIQLMTPDGRQRLYCCNANPITESEARQNKILMAQGRPCLYFTEEGLDRLYEADTTPRGGSAPIHMASGPAEARAYAELHGLTVVTLYLNRRGSENDLAWRRYLERYPEAGAHWNSKYVFVGIYCDGQGSYPPALLQEIQVSIPYGTGDMTPPAALRLGDSHQKVPRFTCQPQPTKGCYTIAEFLNTPPADITFGL